MPVFKRRACETTCHPTDLGGVGGCENSDVRATHRLHLAKHARNMSFSAHVRDSARDMAEQYKDNPKPSNMIAHTFFSRVGSTTLRSTARQTCQCPRRFSIACATNPAWAHKTYLDLSCRRVAAGGARKETTLQRPAVLAANTHADNQRACRSSNLRGHE